MAGVDAQKVWNPPEAEGIKLNVSSINDKSCTKVGIGILALNWNGHCVQAWSVIRDCGRRN